MGAFLMERKDVINMGTTIKIKCIDQTLTYEGTPIVASGGVNEDYIQFEFGPLWFSKGNFSYPLQSLFRLWLLVL